MTDAVDRPAVDAIAALAKNAAGASVLMIPTSGLGAGLPTEVPMLFDHRATGSGLVGLKDGIEKFRKDPERRKGVATVTTLASLIELTKRHKDSQSVIFARAEWPDPKLMAIINYHEAAPGQPRWGDHRVVYPFPVTDEFAAWIEGDGTQMSQGDFAEFIEDHAAELSAPFDAEVTEFERLFGTKIATPAEMVTLSRGLQVFVATAVKNAVTLQSGEGQIVWEEEHRDHAGNKMIVPGLFMVQVPPFIGSDADPVRVPARLRYRAGGGKITWCYHLYRWEQVLRAKVRGDLAEAMRETALPGYEGAAEGDPVPK